ncbi:MAG TPA: ankyrin repeat domain-containing protein [Chthonomonadaceae bacterium]|nr:ankyrin repeat domain-containing protein [Chthonomonadaceae bacterium]
MITTILKRVCGRLSLHRKGIALWLLLLMVVGIPVCYFALEYRQAQRDRALIAAVKANDTEGAIAAIRAGADVNARDYSDRSLSLPDALQRAMDRLLHPQAIPTVADHPTVLFCLMEARYGPMWSRGHPAPWEAENPALLALLLEHGADVNARGPNEMTPLLYAASHGLNASIPLLLEHGSDVNAQTNHGETPLMLAISNGKLQTAQLLLAYHPAINQKDHSGTTAMDYAFANPYGDTRSVILLWDVGGKTGKELDFINQGGIMP